MTSAAHVVGLAGSAEAAAVADLLDRFNREFDSPTPGTTVLTSRLEALLGSSGALALLAGSPPSGVAVLTLRPSVWSPRLVAMLDELYVVPAERGRGIGTALLKAAEQECRARNVERLEINVDGEDTDARRFYERHGYANRDPGQSEPQLYYSRELVPPER
jgi:GNAT superfamily N-acetyltransferase